MSAPLASLVINNHDYGRYLGEAIESALAQNHPATEVVVVDDGSTDDSREVIASYGDRVVAVLKEQGGQASAVNAGFAAARGEVVIFLDADDVLLPGAVCAAVGRLGPGVAKVHWPVREVDKQGRDLGRCRPRERVSQGDLREWIATSGPDAHVSPPTSGNAYARACLERILPMPEPEFELTADAYLYCLAPLFGRIERIDEPLTLYRLHGSNRSLVQSFEDRLAVRIRRYEHLCRMVAHYGSEMGLSIDMDRFIERSWLHRLRLALRDLASVIPTGEPFVLLDEDRWAVGDAPAGRPRIPFPDRDGSYGGIPADDAHAIRELERLRQRADHFVVGWPAFWWLEYYEGFDRHLRASGTRLLSNERLMIFRIGGAA